MKKIFFALALLSSVGRVHAEEPAGTATPVPAIIPLSEEACKNEKLMAQEFLDAELAGVRLQGLETDPPCIKALKPQTMVLDFSERGDEYFLVPEYVLPKGKDVSLTLLKLPNDRIRVKVSYSAKKSSKTESVTDSFILQKNLGRERESMGCASVYTELKHFVMREGCFPKE